MHTKKVAILKNKRIETRVAHYLREAFEKQSWKAILYHDNKSSNNEVAYQNEFSSINIMAFVFLLSIFVSFMASVFYILGS